MINGLINFLKFVIVAGLLLEGFYEGVAKKNYSEGTFDLVIAYGCLSLDMLRERKKVTE